MDISNPQPNSSPDPQNHSNDDPSFPRSEELESADMYAVEQILAKEVVNDQKFYLVHWKGYPQAQSTWEPVENLLNALDLVIEFEVKECLKESNPEYRNSNPEDSPTYQLKVQIPFLIHDPERYRYGDMNAGNEHAMRENGTALMEASKAPKKRKKRMRQDGEHNGKNETSRERIVHHKLKKVKISKSFGGKVIKLKRLKTISVENITVQTTDVVKKKRGRPPKSLHKEGTVSLSLPPKDKEKSVSQDHELKKKKKKDKLKNSVMEVEKKGEEKKDIVKKPRGRPRLIKPTPSSSVEKKEVVEKSPEKNVSNPPKKRGRPFKIKPITTSTVVVLTKDGDSSMSKSSENKKSKSVDSGDSKKSKILLKPTPGKKTSKSERPEKSKSLEKGPEGEPKKKRGRPPKIHINKENKENKEKEEKLKKKLEKKSSSMSVESSKGGSKDGSVVVRKRGRPPKYPKDGNEKSQEKIQIKLLKTPTKSSKILKKSGSKSRMEVEDAAEH